MNFDEYWSSMATAPGCTAATRHDMKLAAMDAWRVATAAEREACIAAVAAEHVGESIDDDCDNDGDKAYNAALRAAARALEERSNVAVERL